MATTRLDNVSWKEYFDLVSRTSRGQHVYVEASGPRLGNQVEVEWLPLTGLVYDPGDDLLEVATEQIDHLIHHPSAIFAHYEADGLHDLEVADHDGNRHIIRLREPVQIPAPS